MESARPIAMWMWRMGRGLGPAGGPRARAVPRWPADQNVWPHAHLANRVQAGMLHLTRAQHTVICDSTETHADAQ